MSDFIKKIEFKKFGCRTKDFSPKLLDPYVNIFVKVTDTCNANCAFCSNNKKYSLDKNSEFDFDKLWGIINELQANNIFINRINITGGEPATIPNIVDKILYKATENNYSKIHLHLNTNGLLPSSQDLMRNPRWDSISVSLHHYDRKKLSEIYGVSIPEKALRFEDINLKKVNASCNLIRGYIDSIDEVEKMLKLAVSLNIPRLGFVALMKINDYCSNHFIDFDEIDFSSIPHLYFTESRNRGKACKCSNYLFNHDLKILEVYMRNYANPQYCESSLLFDGQYLRQGFHNDNIVF